MPVSFRGTALPLDQEGVSHVLEQLETGAPELFSVLEVETSGCGFLPDRRPVILFERHIFSRETEHKFDSDYPDISNRSPGGYGPSGAAQYERLERAVNLDRKAALRSASWGIGQVMGNNCEICGYADVEEMVSEMMLSEDGQLSAMAGFIIHNGLHKALRRKDWAGFARGYNGPAYAKNEYDTKLSGAYEKYSQGKLPDLVVRAAQVYLTYLGYKPGPIDGSFGRRTLEALNQFQRQNGLPLTTAIDEARLAILKDKALSEP